MLESFRLDVPKLDFKELCHDIGSLFAPNKIVLRGKETGKKWFFQDFRQASKQLEEIKNCGEVKRIDFMFIGKSFEKYGPVVEKLHDNAFYEYYDNHDFLS